MSLRFMFVMDQITYLEDCERFEFERKIKLGSLESASGSSRPEGSEAGKAVVSPRKLT